MPQTKTKPRHIDDEDDRLVDDAPVRHRGPESMQALSLTEAQLAEILAATKLASMAN